MLGTMKICKISIIDSEYLLVTYVDRLFFDIFNFYGILLLRKYLNKDFEDRCFSIQTLDEIFISHFNMHSMVIVRGTGSIDREKLKHKSKIIYQEGIGFE